MRCAMLEIVGFLPHGERVVPQRTRGIPFLSGRADLVIEAAIGFEKARFAQHAVEIDLAIQVDFRRHDHGVKEIFELIVEIALDQIGERAVECEASGQQQDKNPARRDRHHPARQTALGPGRRVARSSRNHRFRRAPADRNGRRYERCGIRRAAGRRGRRGCSRVHGSS